MVGAGFLYLTWPVCEPVTSTERTTHLLFLSATSPKTTWRPLSQAVTAVVMKNCEPLLFGIR